MTSSIDQTDQIDQTVTQHAGFAVVTRLLDQIVAGEGIGAELFAADVTLDATVPNWRLTEVGPAAVSAQLSGWFADPASFEALHRLAYSDGGVEGEIVEFTVRWQERGVPHAAHQTHHLTVVDGRIGADRAWCGGRWPAALLAEMEAVNMAVTR